MLTREQGALCLIFLFVCHRWAAIKLDSNQIKATMNGQSNYVSSSNRCGRYNLERQGQLTAWSVACAHAARQVTELPAGTGHWQRRKLWLNRGECVWCTTRLVNRAIISLLTPWLATLPMEARPASLKYLQRPFCTVSLSLAVQLVVLSAGTLITTLLIFLLC